MICTSVFAGSEQAWTVRMSESQTLSVANTNLYVDFSEN